MFPWANSDWDWYDPGHEGEGPWILVLVLVSLDELVVKELRDEGSHIFEVGLSEGLTKADSPSSAEWKEAEGASLLAIRSEEEWVLPVKSLWEELAWSLPLLGVVVQALNVDLYEIILVES